MKKNDVNFNHSAQKTYDSMPAHEKLRVNQFQTVFLEKPEKLDGLLKSPWVSVEIRDVHPYYQQMVYTVIFPNNSLRIKFSFSRGSQKIVNIEEIL